MRSSATRENQRYLDVSPKEKNQNQDLGNHQVYIFKINILFLMREVKKQGTENILHICALCLYGPACPTFSVPSFSREKTCLQVHHICRAQSSDPSVESRTVLTPIWKCWSWLYLPLLRSGHQVSLHLLAVGSSPLSDARQKGVERGRARRILWYNHLGLARAVNWDLEWYHYSFIYFTK